LNAFETNIEMIKAVASALGSELLSKVAFVGGCTTSLYIDDEITKESIRYTNDVDLIIHVIGYLDWHKFQQALKNKGFKECIEDGVLCRMVLKDLRVDFMPDNEKILGFSNKWYKEAYQTATEFNLNDHIKIRLLTPPYFVATKLEAYKGRGNNDPLSSHDLEDILNLFDGREQIVSEISEVNFELKSYISNEISKLFENDYFQYAVQSATKGNKGREKIILERLRHPY
jgi:predicted nucleotidyltransferase